MQVQGKRWFQEREAEDQEARPQGYERQWVPQAGAGIQKKKQGYFYPAPRRKEESVHINSAHVS